MLRVKSKLQQEISAVGNPMVVREIQPVRADDVP